MKLIIYITVLILSLLSCSKDKGNYDYERLPELKIDGIVYDNGTRMLFRDSLVIKPVITFGDEGEASFNTTWYDYTRGKLDTIHNELELRMLVTEAGLKTYVFEVEHKTLGISKRIQTQVLVSSEMERGFYILKETKDGNTDIDAHIRLGINDYILYPNLIKEKIGEALKGKPVDLDYWTWRYNDFDKDTIYAERVFRPASENDIAVFRVSDFAHIGGIPDLFFDVQENDLKIEALKSVGETSLIIYNGGKLRTMANENVSRFQMEYIGDYELEPMMCSPSRGHVFVYDKKAGAFKITGNTTSSLINIPDYGIWGDYMPMNNWDSHLKFFVRQRGTSPPMYRGNGIGYALLQKNKNVDSLFMAYVSLDFASLSMGANSSQVYQIDTLPMGLQLRRGELYTAHEREKYIFYTVGNRVYSYNILNKKENVVIQESDFSGQGGVPDKITYLKYIECKYDGLDNFFDRLFVGGYSGGQYILYAYELIAGKPSGVPMIFTGEGKIKRVVYAAPTNNITPFFIYQ